MKLIDKDRVAAEINRIIDVLEKNSGCSGIFGDAQMSICKKILSFLDTLDSLEGEEVDLEEECRTYLIYNFTSKEAPDEFLTTQMQLDDMVLFAKHFYELGLRAKDVNEIIKTAEDHAYFAGSENTREKLIGKACEWWEKELSYPSMPQKELKWVKCKVKEFRKAMEG